ncbi:MAG: replicative DNA helicase [Tenericutes bacterium]|jgi:replicative DNA helicase|nr:replicative DNA helicase [Bacilli bacterium]MDD3995702.1 replicative DNA helicase [Bacilli bacterium]MDD4831781.1 replicative DNA helicase [Bacilli bacterium]NLV89895.1 replicative DNA helicase [Mycoplasmatota bacterium]
MTERKLPQNIEAEQSVLGSVFISKSALQKVIEDLEKDSFYSSDNSKIYEVLKELYIEGVAIDVTTVSDRLKKKKYFSSSLSAEYLLEIVNSVPTAANVDYYISIVKEKAISRKLIDTATNIATVAYSESEDIGEMLDDAERKILNVVKNRRATEFKNIQDVLFRAQANLEKLSEAGSDITGVASGFHDLDKLTTGFHENELIIVAARPGMGKTAFVLNIATNVASSTKKAVAVFNMEMNAEQLAMRMISSVGQIDGYRIRTGKLENNDWKRVNEAISQLANTNLKIDDTPGITVGEIRAKCRRLASSEEGLELIIIDYLQLVNVGGKNSDNRQQEVAEISRSLKELSLELNVPIIACAQLNRSVDSREDKRPLMSDLRESGSIEQDADIVAFLYRDDYYNKESKLENNNSVVEFIIGKNRSGITSTIKLMFKKNTSTFIGYLEEE